MKKPMNPQHDQYNLTPIGDSALLIELSDAISLKINNRIQALDSQLQNRAIEGILEWVPGYASLMIFYDPLIINLPSVKNHVLSCLEGAHQQTAPTPKLIILNVRYGGEFGPDLVSLAEFHGVSPSEVVRLHTAPTYRVGMMGFTPGFAYLMGLDPDLITPRRNTPRTKVPAGSIGIAGAQTGIYPLESPGGWQLIGRTAQVLYDPASESPFLFSPGDEVRFHPVADGVTP